MANVERSSGTAYDRSTVRTYLLLYALVGQSAIPPLLSLFWPAFRVRYLGSVRWPLVHLAASAAAFAVVEILRP